MRAAWKDSEMISAPRAADLSQGIGTNELRHLIQRLAHDTGTRKKNCDRHGTVAQSTTWVAERLDQKPWVNLALMFSSLTWMPKPPEPAR